MFSWAQSIASLMPLISASMPITEPLLGGPAAKMVGLVRPKLGLSPSPQVPPADAAERRLQAATWPNRAARQRSLGASRRAGRESRLVDEIDGGDPTRVGLRST
jgi:hypothetical protein